MANTMALADWLSQFEHSTNAVCYCIVAAQHSNLDFRSNHVALLGPWLEEIEKSQ